MKQQLQSVLDKIESKHNAHLLLLIITVAFVIIESPELGETETFPDYDNNVKPYLDSCLDNPFQHTRGILKDVFICASYHGLGNERIIPFLFSIALLPITFWFVSTITKTKLAGLLTVLILVSSGTFTYFDTTATYEQSWVVFLILSFTLAWRGNWILSTVFFVLSIMAKPLALIYLLPMIVFILCAPISKQVRNRNLMLIIGLLVIFASVILYTEISGVRQTVYGGSFDYNQDELIAGLYGWFFYLDTSYIVAFTVPLVVIKLAILSRKKIKPALPVLCCIMTVILSVSIVEGFTNQLNHSYRFVPLVIMIATGLSFIITNFIMPKKQALKIE